ncbi:hypothetical protein JCM33374_g3918 [Metschnikowia sp. JCM 33374]|nr:hypothetical protein JCM33374_g3918 [Metschnikowia sp. JCM 33374]
MNERSTGFQNYPNFEMASNKTNVEELKIKKKSGQIISQFYIDQLISCLNEGKEKAQTEAGKINLDGDNIREVYINCFREIHLKSSDKRG